MPKTKSSSTHSNTIIPPAYNTPMLKQYLSIKKEHQDAILFFRLGDFYEMFDQDAKTASKVLDLTLTGRGKNENRIPMCGIPFHAAENYIRKLIKNGFKVAICEQTEDADASAGLTKREVVNVITPGTNLDEYSLEPKENNYLFAIYQSKKKYGFAFADVSTGEFKAGETTNETELQNILNQHHCKEILINNPLYQYPKTILANITEMNLPTDAEKKLCLFFQFNNMTSFGFTKGHLGLSAAYAIIDYLTKTQKKPPLFTQCLLFQIQNKMHIDPTSSKSLELFKSNTTDHKKGSLLWVIDETKTAMGGRKLNQLLQNPLIDPVQINKRLDSIENLIKHPLLLEEIRQQLQECYDIQRLSTRIISQKNNPKDCIALKETLKKIKEISPLLESHLINSDLSQMTHFFQQCNHPQSPLNTVIGLINDCLIEDPPSTIRNGNIIKENFSKELDHLKQSFKDIKSWVQKLEESERENTKIKSLKVRFNKVFGYYIEIPKTQITHVPDHYIRKQTLTNAERYITTELKDKETILLKGEEQQTKLEQHIFNDLTEKIQTHFKDIQKIAEMIAKLDCMQALATLSKQSHYTRPTFSDPLEKKLYLKNNLHPILDKNKTLQLIPNTVNINQEQQLYIITGPNMAGKSTLMRQVALTVILAQIGCYVPAEEAHISPVDQIFTRIGSSDNLYEGQSTFMVEMLESAAILNKATEQSLIILDEIGRGTSTFDGMSIAASIIEYIVTNINARTFFSTHYHEITLLAEKYTQIKNVTMNIAEDKETLIFTYHLKEGKTNKSYGIKVAKMAGLPPSVIQKAEKILTELEKNNNIKIENQWLNS